MNKTSLHLLLSSVALFLVVCNAPAQTQAEMNDAACAKYKKADAEMNAVYQQVLNKYKSETAFVAKFKTAQRAWIAFRDAHLESLYPDPNKMQAYGSVNPVCRCGVLTELTAERTKQLKQWLNGAEEGDVCSGSVKIRN
ncbi:MAG TPA: lysozyme inhibitor LprI family protein [Blastocatellia bacterium]|nr:lysozyme inhibitor LprI family protein [Blastocatellia bacterium]